MTATTAVGTTQSLCEKRLDSSLANLADFAQSDASGQRSSDSDKTYGRDDTEFLRHQTYDYPEAVLSKGRFPRQIKNVAALTGFQDKRAQICPFTQRAACASPVSETDVPLLQTDRHEQIRTR